MSNVTKQVSAVSHVMNHTRAANADQIGNEVGTQTIVETESTASGWDSYQVWRRFIKEARERRRTEG